MMIEWKSEALRALAEALLPARSTYEPDKVRAALDAAVKAQGLEEEIRESALHYISAVGQAQENYARGRADAFKEAATALENSHLTPRNEIAAILRALATE